MLKQLKTAGKKLDMTETRLIGHDRNTAHRTRKLKVYSDTA